MGAAGRLAAAGADGCGRACGSGARAEGREGAAANWGGWSPSAQGDLSSRRRETGRGFGSSSAVPLLFSLMVMAAGGGSLAGLGVVCLLFDAEVDEADLALNLLVRAMVGLVGAW